MTNEEIFLGSCLIEPTFIDKAVAQGLTAKAFINPGNAGLWRVILGIHSNGKKVNPEGIQIEVARSKPEGVDFERLFACENAVSSSLHGDDALKGLLESSRIDALKTRMAHILSEIKNGGEYEGIAESVASLAEVVAPVQSQERSTPDICNGVLEMINSQISMRGKTEGGVKTGIPSFDKAITPIEKHEYVVVGARPSVGKSSFMSQMCGYNLSHGKRCAYFTLETSAESVIAQIACQKVGANKKRLWEEFTEKQEQVRDAVELIKTKPLLVFENDLSLTQIEARCRLIAASFKPDVVFIDYLGLIRTKGEKAYEKMSTLSKAMIPLRKSLGCALVVGAQLNRNSASEGRMPNLTDFRDTGSIEEDAHRVIVLHRPEKTDDGSAQSAEDVEQLIEAAQLKLRDGPRAQGRFTFIAPHTKFVEREA